MLIVSLRDEGLDTQCSTRIRITQNTLIFQFFRIYVMIHTGVNIWGFGTHFVVQSTFWVPAYYRKNFDTLYNRKLCNTITR